MTRFKLFLFDELYLDIEFGHFEPYDMMISLSAHCLYRSLECSTRKREIKCLKKKPIKRRQSAPKSNKYSLCNFICSKVEQIE